MVMAKPRTPKKPAQKPKASPTPASRKFVLQVRLDTEELRELDRLAAEQATRIKGIPWGGGRSAVVRELIRESAKKKLRQ